MQIWKDVTFDFCILNSYTSHNETETDNLWTK